MPSRTPPYADSTLSVYLAPLAAGRRVLWLGAGGEGARALLGEQAARVETREATEGLSEIPPGGFDLVVVPDAEPLGTEAAGGVAAVARIVGAAGIAVLGWPVNGDAAHARERLAALANDRFEAIRFLGQARFEGFAVAELDRPPGEVVVDGSLLGASPEPPARVLAICSAASAAEVEPYAIIGAPSRAEGGAAAPEPGAAGGDDEELGRFEAALAERARRVRELEAEVERRGQLVRDLIEELRGVRPSGDRESPTPEAGDVPQAGAEAAVQRAVEAEAARAEALFRIDELEARLAEVGEEARSLRDANLEGTIRGLRSRVAELEELRGLAEGRLELTRMDLSAASERERQLERQLGELRDQFELELIRARGAEFALRERTERAVQTERELTRRLDSVRGENAGLRARLKEREDALEALRAAATPSQDGRLKEVEAERDRLRGELAELREEREGLVTRLQHDLAQEEEARRRLEEQQARLREENERLRSATVDASSAVDERDALARRVADLERALAEDREALRAARDMLAGLPRSEGGARPPHEITAAGMESPATAADEGAPEELRRQLRSLQERAARLQEELEHERQARRAESGASTTSPGTDPASEVRRLHGLLGDRDAEVELLKGKLASQDREAGAMRDAFIEARRELEDLLGAATESGDPATAERIGSLLRLLGQF
ncbi:MAG: hypothetical protein ACODAU_09220 [Myxococcota bacterium]